MINRSEKNIIYILLGCFSLALIALALRNLDASTLQYYSLDEHAFLGVLYKMHDGLSTFNMRDTFAYSFYTYGFSYFFAMDIVAWPFFYHQHDEIIIFIARLFSLIPAVISFYYIYKILRLYISHIPSIIIVLFGFSMPGIWVNGIWFHPDWLMTCMLLIALYKFMKDEFAFKRNFWWAIIFLGEAIALKFQAITFIPLLALVVFHEEVFQFKFTHVAKHILLGIKAGALMLLVFIINNPFIVHPKGIRSFTKMLDENLLSNKTNHMSFKTVTLSEKLHLAINDYYIISLVIVLILLATCWFIWKYRNDSQYRLLISTYLVILINVAYILFFVNKSWQHYYLTVGLLASLLLVALFIILNNKKNIYLASGILLLNIGFHLPQFRNLFATDYRVDATITQETPLQEDDLFIRKHIQIKSGDKTRILSTLYTYCNFYALNLSFGNVVSYFGRPLQKEMINLEAFMAQAPGLKPEYFKQPNYIIINKRLDQVFNASTQYEALYKSALADARNLYTHLHEGHLGYSVLAENDNLLIYIKN
jgi:hypothetical protein